MDKQTIARLQRDLKALDLYPGDVDGDWGPLTEEAYKGLVEAARARGEIKDCENRFGDSMAWGRKVSATFKARVRWIAEQLGFEPDWLMACIAFESAETFRADIKNAAGSGATGLIQFMPNTARALGTSTEALAKMTPEDQLNVVYQYFRPYKGRIKNLGDLYMAILWPAGIGKPDEWVLWGRDSRPTTYRQNSGLDLNKDAAITRAEALTKIQEKLDRGLKASFYG